MDTLAPPAPPAGSTAATPAPQPARFNPLSPAFKRDPYPAYEALRQRLPFKTLGMWVVTRHDDVAAVLKDRRFSAALIPSLVNRQLTGHGLQCPEIVRLGEKSIVFTDAPDHARLRQLTNAAFHRKTIETLRPVIEATVDELLGPALVKAEVELVGEVTEPLPLRVIRQWMGLDASAEEPIKHWTHLVRVFLEPGFITAERYAELHRMLLDYMAFFRGHIERVRVQPDGHLISLLAHHTHKGDRLSDEELIFVCIMCYVAGVETTTSLLSNAVLLFARHPEQFDLLRAQPKLLGQAVDEVLRFESPLQMTKRVASEDLCIAGVDIRAGDQVLLCMGAANRDEAVFTSAQQFDISRQNAARHVGFGHGIHTCLGAFMAQLQLEVFLSQLVASGKRPQVADGPLHWSEHSLILRGLAKLPVRFA
jgi:cytochrome P450